MSFRSGSARRRSPQDAWQGAKEKGADLAENTVDAVRARPIAATGVVAAIAMFLAREPLMDLAGKSSTGVGNEDERPARARKTNQDQRRKRNDRQTRRTTDDDDAAARPPARNRGL